MNDEFHGDSFTVGLGGVVDHMQREMALRVLLKSIECPNEPLAKFKLREGLVETPARAAKAWKHWMAGYAIEPATLLKVFEDGAKEVDEMVVVCDIPVYSTCEHHMAPIFGRACVGYVPNGRVVGLSKIHRVVDAFARRLQVQERLTVEIAKCLMDNLKPRGVGVILRCRHMCIESRGVSQQGTVTSTSSLLGVFKEGVPRAEFLQLAKFEATI